MDDRILVDTSIWIDFLSRKDPLVITSVSGILKGGRVVIAGIILTELIQGARDEGEVNRILELLKPLESIPFSENLWEEAGLFSQKLRKKGLPTPTVDILIAHLAIANNCLLYTRDKHFLLVSRHSSLRLFHDQRSPQCLEG